ncbi:S1C family serine protease [Erysipelothrix sp. D19-032]
MNLNGELIGINSMKLNPQQVEGMGFAIPKK